MTQFSDFPFVAPIMKALAREGYVTPTPIQIKAIPLVLSGRDVLGIAQTGTGKTAAFALPILDRLARSTKKRMPKSCRALILSPTRELANQIAESCRAYGRDLALKTEVIFGGVPVNRNIRACAPGVDILVATPGRLLDLIDQRALTLSEIEMLVLDEADQMLDLGFIHALKRIVAMLPKQRQSLFFSATMPETIAGLAAKFLTDPVEVAVAPVATTAERVDQGVMFVPQKAKQALLANVLKDEAFARVLVFTRTKHGADRVVRHMEKERINAAAIHGNKSQPQRERALKSFRDGETRVLIATDIAARGIDVDGVTHVINFELPNIPESYVHRIGRTARAGNSGIALSFCADDEKPYLRDIQKLTRMTVPVMPLPEGFVMPDMRAIEQGERQDRDERRQGDRNGDRGGRGEQGRPQRGRSGNGKDRSHVTPNAGRFNDGTNLAPVTPIGARPKREIDSIREADRQAQPQRAERPFVDRQDRPARDDRPQRRDDRPAHGGKPPRDRSFGGLDFGDRKPDGYAAEGREPRREGGKPFGQRPQGDRPQGGKPFGQRPHGERSQGDRPQGGKPGYGKPFGGKGFGEKSFGDKPRSNDNRDAAPRAHDDRAPRSGDDRKPRSGGPRRRKFGGPRAA